LKPLILRLVWSSGVGAPFHPGNLFDAANKVCLRGGLNLEEF
jgi:hypothetical protein